MWSWKQHFWNLHIKYDKLEQIQFSTFLLSYSRSRCLFIRCFSTLCNRQWACGYRTSFFEILTTNISKLNKFMTSLVSHVIGDPDVHLLTIFQLCAGSRHRSCTYGIYFFFEIHTLNMVNLNKFNFPLASHVCYGKPSSTLNSGVMCYVLFPME